MGRGLIRTSGTVVRPEELGIVLVVLMLWVAAITLFINRWGKIRLMEPYQVSQNFFIGRDFISTAY
jgi:hypothetical protein